LSAVQPWRWQRELAEAVTDPRELLAILGLPESLAEPAERAGKAFSLRVTRSFIARMSRGDPNDPLLRQVLPVGDELAEIAGYSADPLEEGAARRAPQLLHKYTGRALLIATEACAIHCRYCFRREFPYTVPETRVSCPGLTVMRTARLAWVAVASLPRHSAGTLASAHDFRGSLSRKART